MKKKLTALFLALVMCMTMSAPAFAAETDPYADLRESIYLQLEAQDALHLYDDFVEVLIPKTNNTRSMNGVVYSTNAVNGGILHYCVDETYRGEDGTKIYNIQYLNEKASKDYIINAATPNWKDVVLHYLGKVPGFFGTVFTMASESETFLESYGIADIISADYFGKIVSIYDPFSDVIASVATGWHDHCRVELNNSDAYDIVWKRY